MSFSSLELLWGSFCALYVLSFQSISGDGNRGKVHVSLKLTEETCMTTMKYSYRVVAVREE